MNVNEIYCLSSREAPFPWDRGLKAAVSGNEPAHILFHPLFL